MKRRLIIWAVAVTMAVWAVIAIVVVTSGQTGSSVQPTVLPPVHPDIFFVARYFSGTEDIPAAQTNGFIRGAVVPHHQLAGKLTGEVFSLLREGKPDTVFIIGPNHKNLGAGVITSSVGWSTPFGTVSCNQEIISKLEAAGLAIVDDQVIGAENAVGSLMPYVKYYLPKAKVVPVILNHNIGLEETNTLGAALAQLGGKKAVVIASVDFSHYLSAEEATKKDKETKTALEERNLGRLFQMGDDHLDSPPSIGTLFGAMDAWASSDLFFLRHTNSGEILGNGCMETTSYFTLVFPEGGKI